VRVPRNISNYFGISVVSALRMSIYSKKELAKKELATPFPVSK
jgi:hypothetical protein